VWEAANLTCLGNCNRYMGRLDKAVEYYGPSLEINRETGNRNGEAFVLDALGCVALLRGNSAEARDYLEQALSIQRQLENEHEIAVLYLSLGAASLAEGDAARARTYYADAIPVFVRLKSQRQLSSCFDGLCRIARSEGDFVRATRMRAVADALRKATGIVVPLEPDAGPEVIDELRAKLGAAEFARAWADGSVLPVENAMAEALRAD
jgi:tetratricopeptide (TPR) repeat protein